MLRETKENVQGTNSEAKDNGLKSMVWTRRKKETSNQKRMKKHKFKKNEERRRNLQDIFKRSNIQIIGVPEGEEEEQKIENLFERIIGELPSPGKGNRLLGSPGSSESPKEAGPKEEHTKAHHNYVTQD